jgi:hypothetical protein
MSRKKRERKHAKKVAKHIEKMRQAKKPKPEKADEPKVVPDIKDNLALFEKRSSNIDPEIADWQRKQERVKAGRLHEEFKRELVKTGKTGKEVFDALDEFSAKLKREIKDKDVRDDAVATVKAMKDRLLLVLSVPKNEKPEAN